MNKKISTLLAAFLAAGYSYTVEAGIVKVTKITAGEQYVISVSTLNDEGNTVLTSADESVSFTAMTEENGFVGATQAWEANSATKPEPSSLKVAPPEYFTLVQGDNGLVFSAGEQMVRAEGGAFSFGDSPSTLEITEDGEGGKFSIAGDGNYLDNTKSDAGYVGDAPVYFNFYTKSDDLEAVTKENADYFTIDGKYLVAIEREIPVRTIEKVATLMTAEELWAAIASGSIKENQAKWFIENNLISSLAFDGFKVSAFDGSTFSLSDDEGLPASFLGNRFYLGENEVMSMAADGDGLSYGDDAVSPLAAIKAELNDNAVAFTADRPFYLALGESNYVGKDGEAKDNVNVAAIVTAVNVPNDNPKVYKFMCGDKTLAMNNTVEFVVKTIPGTNGFYLMEVGGTEDANYLQEDLKSWGAIDGAAKFSLVQPEATNFTSYKTLAAIEKNGFTVTLKYGDNKTDLKENPFKGHLTMMYKDGEEFKPYSDKESSLTEAFYLKSSEGFIVGDKDMFKEATEEIVYGFKTISEDDLKKDIAKGAEAAYVSTFNAQYYKNQEGALTEIVLLLGTNTKIGYYSLLGSKYVGAGLNPFPVTFALGSGSLVKAQDLLVKNHFYTIVMVDEEEGNKTLAVKLGENNNSNNAWGTAAFLQNISNDLEKQWALTVVGANYVFSNRETPTVTYTIPTASLYYAEEGDNTYTSGENTFIITPVEVNAADGYERLTNVLDTKYNLGYWSDVFGGNTAWFTENHKDIADNAHVVGLIADKESALEFTAKAFDAQRVIENDAVKTATDSVYVISTLGYYDENDLYKTTKDTLKIVSYAFVNEFGEPFAMGKDKEGEAAYVSKVTDANKDKYESFEDAVEDAQRFVLRKDGDKLNLRPVALKEVGGKHYEFDFSEDFNKVFSGDTEKGILADTKLYSRVENDRFVIEATDMPVYRTITNVLDTISIFRQGNDKDVMYEKKGFLGIANAVQFPTIAPAMVADLAYVDAEGHRPQYLLMVEPNYVPAGMWCEEHQSATCEHAVPTRGYTEGRYLVNLKDTAIVWSTDNHQKGNPYVNSENYYKLGFVQATHMGDSLIFNAVEPTAADTINMDNKNYNVAKFAFRYVDNEEESFVIETADFYELGAVKDGESVEGKMKGENDYAYLKWMNDVVVVVDNIEDADVFNMNEEFEGNPTANDAINASGVSVATTNGAVIVKGAAGKNVVITNVLGQTIANTVVSSDEVTIAAPKGYVTVAVEGEAAVKAIVK